MSDDDNGDEDYGFQYSDDSDPEEDVDIENAYYSAKGLIDSDPADALDAFERVIEMEKERGEWGFKALKQIVKLHFRQQRFPAMMERYAEFLEAMPHVTRNFSEQSINSILDFVGVSKDMDFLQRFYEATLDALKQAKNERLWFKTNLKLGTLYYDQNEFTKLHKILKELHQSCVDEEGQDDQRKGTQLLEVFALEIQMHTATKNHKKLKDLYERSLRIKSAIPHPRIMAIIRECGGKMHLEHKMWTDAYTDFFEAFKNYDEAGSQRRIQCLKYLVLSNMLSDSEINPFDSQEAKPYKDDPEIVAMTNLVAVYMRGDIDEFERILRKNRATIMDDPFIRHHMEELLTKIRTNVLSKLVVPYTHIRLAFIAKNLNISVEEVESLLVALIQDDKVKGKIDQVNQLLVLERHTATSDKYSAMAKWASQLQTLQHTVLKA